MPNIICSEFLSLKAIFAWHKHIYLFQQVTFFTQYRNISSLSPRPDIMFVI